MINSIKIAHHLELRLNRKSVKYFYGYFEGCHEFKPGNSSFRELSRELQINNTPD